MTFAAEPPQGYWPIYKGESFDIWSPDNGSNSYYAWAEPETLRGHLQQKRIRSSKAKASPFSEFDDAWLRDENTLPCIRPRIAFRDISRATDSRTVRAALVPPKILMSNTAPYGLRSHGTEEDEAFLLGLLSSIPLDWYARRIVETHVNFYIFNSFPIPRPNRDDSLRQRVVSLSGRLAAPDERFADWANAVGVRYGPLEPNVKEDMLHELDAAVPHLYGLSESQLRHIFETFHVGWDYEDRLASTLDHYHRMESLTTDLDTATCVDDCGGWTLADGDWTGRLIGVLLEVSATTSEFRQRLDHAIDNVWLEGEADTLEAALLRAVEKAVA